MMNANRPSALAYPKVLPALTSNTLIAFALIIACALLYSIRMPYRRQLALARLAERTLYESRMGLRSTGTPAERVVLVTLPPGSSSAACRLESTLTDLIPALDQQASRVIAINHGVDVDNCADPAIQKAFRSMLSRTHAPVVLGAPTGAACNLTTSPSLASTQFGFTCLDENPLKIPLEQQGPPDREPGASLSLSTAYAAKPELRSQSGLSGLLRNDERPFVNLPTAIPEIAAPSLLTPTRGLFDLGHKIVVVGERTPATLHRFADLPRYDLDLQAGYIEALLSGHYVQPVSTLKQTIVLFVFVLILAALDWIATRSRTLELAALAGNWVALVLLYLASLVPTARIDKFCPIIVLSLIPLALLLFIKTVVTLVTRRRRPVAKSKWTAFEETCS